MAKPSPRHSGDAALVAIGAALRSIRKEKDISQEALAHDAGIDRSYLGGMERGEHNMTILNLLRVAEPLGVSGSELLQRAGL